MKHVGFSPNQADITCIKSAKGRKGVRRVARRVSCILLKTTGGRGTEKIRSMNNEIPIGRLSGRTVGRVVCPSVCFVSPVHLPRADWVCEKGAGPAARCRTSAAWSGRAQMVSTPRLGETVHRSCPLHELEDSCQTHSSLLLYDLYDLAQCCRVGPA